MTDTFADELLWRMKPTLQRTYALQDTLPLQLKLQLERLRLAELIRSRCHDVAPVYAMT